MPKLVAAVLAATLLSVSGLAALQHVHLYGGHDHAEHHHGVSAHAHAARAHHDEPGTPDDWPRLEACDPAMHQVAAVFSCVTPAAAHSPVLLIVVGLDVAPPRAVWRAAVPDDVRVHGPPRLYDAPLRAPPAVHPA